MSVSKGSCEYTVENKSISPWTWIAKIPTRAFLKDQDPFLIHIL